MQRKLVGIVRLRPRFGSAHASRRRARAAAPISRDGIKDHPVTADVLKNPDPADWLMYSRTYDAQRFSPLAQIDRGNVGTLQRAWTKELPSGPVEAIPLVYRGVMYLLTPGGRDGGSRVWALDATNGNLLWEYKPADNGASRIKALAIYEDMIYYTAPARRRRTSRAP